MVPYPPPYAQAKTEENLVLRSLGAILALLGLALAALGIIFHQNGAELALALLIAILSLRVFILWLGDTQQNRKREPFTPPSTASRNSQALIGPYPPSSGHVLPAPQSAFQPVGTNQMTVPFTSAAPGVPFVPADVRGMPPALPPSIRPQAQSGFFPNRGQAVPPGFFAPSTQPFPPAPEPAPVPAPYAPGQPVPPALLPPPGQTSANWSYAPAPPMPPAFPAQSEQAASNGQWRPQPVQEEDWQE